MRISFPQLRDAAFTFIDGSAASSGPTGRGDRVVRVSEKEVAGVSARVRFV